MIGVEGFGAQLARAREARGWSPADVAGQLKLSARQVEALEAEDLARLPGPVFVRGFIRNYARLVGLNPETLLAATDVRQIPTETITAPSEGVRLGGSSLGKWLLLPLLLLALFVLMVSGMYYWLRQGESVLLEPLPPQPAAALPATPHTEPQEAVLRPAASPESELSPAQAPVATQAAASALAPPPIDLAETAPPAVSAEPSVTQPVQRHAVLHFHVLEDAWIRVDDRDGQRFAKLLRAGTSEQVRGNPPFRLVVGNAASVRLEYNQQPIDLKPFIGEKVARLTLE